MQDKLTSLADATTSNELALAFEKALSRQDVLILISTIKIVRDQRLIGQAERLFPDL